jgi:hypothetical protein
MDGKNGYEFTERDKQTIESMSTEVWKDRFKERQLSYMTAAIMWFVVLAVLLIAGSSVWKLCLAIAS